MGALTAQDWAVLIAAFGGGALIPQISKAIYKKITGAVGAERRGIEYERQRADVEASKRRRVEEHASTLRRIIIENCGPQLTLPDWPIENTVPRRVSAGRDNETEEDS